jgi:peptidoglycan/LPS O-acetylase OafA/YrhL
MYSENKPLTAIRGFAALWVVSVHLEMAWSFPVGAHGHAALMMGRVAVDGFFVLSGFILTLVYPDLTGPGTGDFALRRICRIYPLHLCIITVLGLAALYTALHSGKAHPWQSFLPTVLLVQPYLGIESLWNGTSWSLGVELLCYIFFPLINTAIRLVKRPGLMAAVVTCAVIEAVVLYYYDGSVAGPGAVFRALAGFTLGCALARLFMCEPAAFAKYSAVLQVAALGGLAVSVYTDQVIGSALSAAVLIAAIASTTGPIARFLSARVSVWLGRNSFSIYLLHMPLYTMFAKLPVVLAALPVGSLRFVIAGVYLAVLLAMSELTYNLIERPGRRLPRLLIHRTTPAMAHGST